ncbi:MAG TPA: hypothetical protein PLD37_05410, partial [Usitatibacteraceae bacterium]|nr:hypothetical protein [Usitatibacteraceae bacterium]
AGGKLLHGKGGAPEGREGMGWTLVTALGCLALTLVWLAVAWPMARPGAGEHHPDSGLGPRGPHATNP